MASTVLILDWCDRSLLEPFERALSAANHTGFAWGTVAFPLWHAHTRIQESSGGDASDLYMNLRQQELQTAAAEKAQRHAAIPGMIGTQSGSINSPFGGQGGGIGGAVGGAPAPGFM